MKGFSRQLKQAMSEAEAVVNERKRIREALSKAEVDRIDKEAAVVEAQRKLGAEEADAALSGRRSSPARPGVAGVMPATISKLSRPVSGTSKSDLARARSARSRLKPT